MAEQDLLELHDSSEDALKQMARYARSPEAMAEAVERGTDWELRAARVAVKMLRFERDALLERLAEGQ